MVAGRGVLELGVGNDRDAARNALQRARCLFRVGHGEACALRRCGRRHGWCGGDGFRRFRARLFRGRGDGDGRQSRGFGMERAWIGNRCGRHGTQRANVALHRSYSSKDVIRAWCWKRSRFGRAARGMRNAEPAGDGNRCCAERRRKVCLRRMQNRRGGRERRRQAAMGLRTSKQAVQGMARLAIRVMAGVAAAIAVADHKRIAGCGRQRPRRRVPGRPAATARPARTTPQGRRATFRSDAMLAAVDTRRPPSRRSIIAKSRPQSANCAVIRMPIRRAASTAL